MGAEFSASAARSAALRFRGNSPRRGATRRALAGASSVLLIGLFVGAALPASAALSPRPLDSVLLIEASLNAARANLTANTTDALAHLDDAASTFEGELVSQSLAAEAAPIGSEWRIAWQAARDAAESSNATRFGHFRQLMVKLDYSLAWVEAWHHLNITRDVDAAAAWFEVVAWKFVWTGANSDAASAMENISAAPTSLDARKTVVFNATVEQFAGKVLEEVSEVSTALPADVATAAEKSAEGLGYFYGIRPAIEERLGAAKAAAAEGAVRASVAAAWRADKEGAQAAQAAVDLALAEFRGLSDVSGVFVQMRSLAQLVGEEYALAVAGGTVVDPVEYNESLDFFESLEAKWAQVETSLRVESGGPQVADEIDALMASMGANLTAKADPSQVASLVGELGVEFTEASRLTASADGPAVLTPAASPAPWVLLGLMLGLILGTAIGTVAFAAYVRRLRARPAPSVAAKGGEAP